MDEMDARIACLEKVDESLARKLKVERNQLAPISQLPNEVMVVVFASVSAQDVHRNVRIYNPRICRYNPTACIRALSQVCHRWYNIVVNCPQLWSTILIPSSHRWTEVAVARSGRLPLSLVVGGWMDRDQPVEDGFSQVMQHSNRLQRLELLNGYVPRDGFSAPNLQTLIVRHEDYFDYCLDPRLLKGPAPALRTVEVSRWQFDWKSSFFDGLTTLRLVSLLPGEGYLRDESLRRNTLEDFVAALRRMPYLEIFELRAPLPFFPLGDDPVASTALQPVPMRHLAILHLVAELHECAGVLRHMLLPPTTVVMIETIYVPRPQFDVPGLMCALTSAWISQPLATSPSRPDVKFRSCTIEYQDNGHGIVFGGWFNDVGFQNQDRPVGLWIAIQSNNRWDSLHDTISLLPLADLGSLCLAAAPEHATLDLLGKLPHLEEILLLETDAATSFVDFLGRGLRSSDTEEEIAMPNCILYYRRLRVIGLECVIFEGKSTREHLQLDRMLDTLVLRAEALKEQAGDGVIELGGEGAQIGEAGSKLEVDGLCQIRRLWIRRGYNLFEDDLVRARQIIREVDWDEHVETFTGPQYY